MQDRRRPIGRRRWLLFSALTMLLGLAGSLAQAMPVKWRSANFKYAVDGKPVREVLRDFDGDAFAPVLDPANWQAVSREDAVSADGLPYGFVRYEKKPG